MPSYFPRAQRGPFSFPRATTTKSRTIQPRHGAVPRKHIADGPQGAANRVRARQRSSLQKKHTSCPEAGRVPGTFSGLASIGCGFSVSEIQREVVERHGEGEEI